MWSPPFSLSCTLLLAVSWAHKLIVPPEWDVRRLPGVPVKDYIVQSGKFLLCAFALAHLALSAWAQQRRTVALALTALALLFLANIVFVISSRTTLVVFPVMLIVLALQRLSWKGGIAFVLAASVLAVAAGSASPFLRYRTLLVIDEVTRYHSEDAETSAGYRLEFWKKSIEFVAQAPLIGHGTGSTKTLFRAAASGTGDLGGVHRQPAQPDPDHRGAAGADRRRAPLCDVVRARAHVPRRRLAALGRPRRRGSDHGVGGVQFPAVLLHAGLDLRVRGRGSGRNGADATTDYGKRPDLGERSNDAGR